MKIQDVKIGDKVRHIGTTEILEVVEVVLPGIASNSDKTPYSGFIKTRRICDIYCGQEGAALLEKV